MLAISSLPHSIISMSLYLPLSLSVSLLPSPLLSLSPSLSLSLPLYTPFLSSFLRILKPQPTSLVLVLVCPGLGSDSRIVLSPTLSDRFKGTRNPGKQSSVPVTHARARKLQTEAVLCRHDQGKVSPRKTKLLKYQ